MDTKLPIPDLPEDSIAQIEAVRARSVSRLRSELQQYWRLICASESGWQGARPSDLAPMLGQYLAGLLDAYGKEILPSRISDVDVFLESLRNRLRRDELVGRILPQNGVERLPIIGYRETLGSYEEGIVRLRKGSNLDPSAADY